jgi:hypothetical protein
MNTSSLLRAAMVALATFGVCLPQQLMAANPVIVDGIPVHREVESLELQNGRLIGGLVDQAGRGVADAPVIIAQDGKAIAKLRSDAEGRFAADGLSPGRYHVISHGGVRTFDVYAAGSAPAGSQRGVIQQVDPEVARGAAHGGKLMQFVTNPIVIALAIAAAVAIPLAIDDDDDDAS